MFPPTLCLLFARYKLLPDEKKEKNKLRKKKKKEKKEKEKKEKEEKSKKKNKKTNWGFVSRFVFSEKMRLF